VPLLNKCASWAFEMPSRLILFSVIYMGSGQVALWRSAPLTTGDPHCRVMVSLALNSKVYSPRVIISRLNIRSLNPRHLTCIVQHRTSLRVVVHVCHTCACSQLDEQSKASLRTLLSTNMNSRGTSRTHGRGCGPGQV